ncbi:hypothetical protein [Actinophytocola sediminis]
MLSDWWNGVELWMAGLAFPFQFAIVLAVVLPVVLVVAWLIDRIVDHAAALFGPSRAEDPPIGTTQPVVEPDATDSGAEDENSAESGQDTTHRRVPAA